MNQQTNLFKPRRVAARLHYSMISQFMYIWVKFGRPCDLNVQRSRKEPETIGVCFNVENNETTDMMRDLIKTMNIEIIDL